MKKFLLGAIPTLAMLLAAILSLSGITYAWFTAGNQATVDTIDVNVQSVDGLVVSLNGYNGTWGSVLSPTFEGQNTTLRPVSGSVSGNTMKFFSAGYDNVFDAIVSAKDVTASQASDGYGNYMKFTFYIKNEGSEAKNVNLTDTTVTSSGLSRAASRIAFVTEGKASASAVLNDNTAPACAAADDAKGVVIFEPNYLEHTQDAVKWYGANNITYEKTKVATKAINTEIDNADGTYYNVATGDKYTKAAATIAEKTGETSNVGATDKFIFDEKEASRFRNTKIDDFYTVLSYSEALTMIGNKTTGIFTRSDKDGVVSYTAVTQNAELVNGTLYYKAQEIEYFTKNAKVGDDNYENVLTETATADADATFITVPANSIVKVSVFIWIEGQDADCTNYVAGIPFKIDIKLNKKA